MLELKTDKQVSVDYEQDLAVWYERQIELLRERRFDQLDLDNLLEELRAAVGKDRRELSSRLEVLLIDLLKCQFQHQRIANSWKATLDEQRSEIAKLLDESPSLGPTVLQVATKVFPAAARRAARETRLLRTSFPVANIYTRAQLLDPEFFP